MMLRIYGLFLLAIYLVGISLVIMAAIEAYQLVTNPERLGAALGGWVDAFQRGLERPND